VNAPKRRWKRFKVDIRVKIRQWEEPDDAANIVRTYELSEGGLSVYASVTLEIGAAMLVEFSLPSSKRALRVRAVVRNRRGFRCGLEFVEISVADRLEILRYLGTMEGAGES
jgi:c-di-GMP-binding flagellar brake protein YcgR